MVFVRKDLDGFYGLMINNLIQLILIVSLYRELIYLPDSYMFGKILSGTAISIPVGNFFYTRHLRQLVCARHDPDVRLSSDPRRYQNLFLSDKMNYAAQRA